MKFKRILLKLSGESLSCGFGIDKKRAENVSKKIKKMVNLGLEIGIVIGAGNFWRGRSGSEISRVRSDQMGILATSMNALCLSDFLERDGVSTLIQSSIEIPGIVKKFYLNDVLEALKTKVVIFSSGTGLPFVSTDTCAAIRASEIGADVILKGTTVDGVYSSDPKVDKNAIKYDSLSFDKILTDNLRVMDISAISICRDNKMPILVCLFDDIERVFAGENIGTFISY